ncbi:hypothetical protein GCM10011345_10660 [Gemmobacter megaterium]|nr:hypothetical protein GCM10011345_10660 [Gemmobacter megaterium]
MRVISVSCSSLPHCSGGGRVRGGILRAKKRHGAVFGQNRRRVKIDMVPQRRPGPRAARARRRLPERECRAQVILLDRAIRPARGMRAGTPAHRQVRGNSLVFSVTPPCLWNGPGAGKMRRTAIQRTWFAGVVAVGCMACA